MTLSTFLPNITFSGGGMGERTQEATPNEKIEELKEYLTPNHYFKRGQRINDRGSIINYDSCIMLPYLMCSRFTISIDFLLIDWKLPAAKSLPQG